MIARLAPIRVASVGAGLLRLFKPPPCVTPDVPWVSYDDLLSCLGLADRARRPFHQRLMSGPFKADVRVVDTPDGIATIAPHDAAQSLIEAMVEAGMANTDFVDAYLGAVIAAFLDDGS
jgi:hypothetical protein